MSNNFYETECLPRVKAIARELDQLASHHVDTDEIESRITELEDFDDPDDYIENPNYDEDDDDSEAYILTEAAQAELEELREQLSEYENGAAVDLYGYFDDPLDIEYRVGSDGDYRSVAVTVGTGGPHIEVDTGDNCVKLWWGGDKAKWGFDSSTGDAIDDIFREMYENCRM